MSDSTKTKPASKSASKGGLPLSIRTRKERTSVRRRNSRAASSVRRKSSVASKRRSIQTAPKSPISPSTTAPVAPARKGTGFLRGLSLFGFGSKKSKKQPVVASPSTQQVQEDSSAPVEKVEEASTTVPVAEELPKIEATSSDLFAGITSPSGDPSVPEQSSEEKASLSVDDSQALSDKQAAAPEVPAGLSSDKRPDSIQDSTTVPDPASSTDIPLAPTPSIQAEDSSPSSPKFKLTVSTANLDVPLFAEAPRSPTSVPLPSPTPGELDLITQDGAASSAADQASLKSPPSLVFSHATGSDADLLSPLTPSTADFNHQVRGRRTSSTRKTEDSILEDEGAEDSRSRSRSRSRERSTDGARASSPLRSGSSIPTASKKLSPLTILTPSSEALPKVEESEEDDVNPGSGSGVKFVVSLSPTSPEVPQSAKSEAYTRNRTSSLNTDSAHGSGASIKRSLTLNLFSRDGPTRRKSFFGLGSSKKDKEEEQKATKQGGNSAEQSGSRLPPSRSFTTPSAGTAAERRSSVSTKDSRALTPTPRTPMTLDIRSYGSVGCDIDNLKVKGAGDDASGTGVVVDEETKRLTESAFFA